MAFVCERRVALHSGERPRVTFRTPLHGRAVVCRGTATTERRSVYHVTPVLAGRYDVRTHMCHGRSALTHLYPARSRTLGSLISSTARVISYYFAGLNCLYATEQYLRGSPSAGATCGILGVDMFRTT